MTDTVIKVEDLSKQYRLGQIGTGTLSHDINRWWHKMRGKEDPYLRIGEVNVHEKKGESNYVWALKDINFEVKRGESLAIIGKNGAGKSTLLKILSRVTGPTTGRFKVKGRIASLLEVGTGFHQELTGRENVFMNGAILGMTRQEITRKFDEIVAFSGIERYIDTPAKRYSSGMFVRLAFAVAAHLDSEILIADEVLAVGDAEFQKKCLGKMKDVTSEGRTVLFVSHSMPAVRSFCKTAVLLRNGSVSMTGNVDEVVKEYMLRGDDENQNIKTFSPPLHISNNAKMYSLSIYQPGKSIVEPIAIDAPVIIEADIEISEVPPGKYYHITYIFKGDEGNILFISNSGMADNFSIDFIGRQKIQCFIPANFFNSGTFYVSFQFVENRNKVIIREEDVINLVLIEGERQLGSWMGHTPGFLKPKFEWKMEPVV
ncbi:MAG TPA: ABC transporter ATP-binding protein [Bacteroidia bacterium]|jgi:lipopolysaccharide transport system ATP-binding protein|nr:ABC transporter ATP-binding protein [Bacteroidia bacterium]